MKPGRRHQTTLRYVVTILISLILVRCEFVSDFPPLPPASPSPQPSTITATPTEPATPTPTVTSAPRIMTLGLWVPDFLSPYEELPGADIFNEQLAAFTNAFPDTQVRVIVKKDRGPGGLYDLLETSSEVAPSVLPDLIVLNQHDLQSAAEEGLIQPLSDVEFGESDYYPAALTAMESLDNYWGYAYVGQADQTAYRQEIASTPPLSWTGVLTSGYSMLFPAAPTDELASDTLLAIYLGSGGRVVDDTGQPTLERASLENVYTFFLEMREAGLLNPIVALELPDAEACWARYLEGAGQLTPVPMGLYWLAPPENTLPAWPPTADGAPITILHTWGVAIVTDDPLRIEAAVNLAQWLTAADRMAALTQSAQLVPTRREAVEAWTLLPEETAFLHRLLASSEPVAPPGVDTPVRRALQAGLVVLLRGDVDTAEAAASYALTNLRR